MAENFMFFLLLLFMPFLPGIIELLIKRDEDPLNIKQDFSKDPAFFGKSFRNILGKALRERAKMISKDTIKLSLSSSKPEMIKIYHEVVSGKHLNEIVYGQGEEVRTDGPLETYKEVVINKNFKILHPCNVRSLLVLGNLKVNDSLNVARWIHVEERAEIEAKSNLGVNFFAKEIKINSLCEFKRMFAEKIEIGQEIEEGDFRDSIPYYIKGTLRSEGTVNIKAENENLIVEGNIISNDDIVVEGNVWIKGNIFSHKGVVLLKRVIVGENQKIKSVVGKKGVVLGEGVKIYGYVHTDGKGVVDL